MFLSMELDILYSSSTVVLFVHLSIIEYVGCSHFYLSVMFQSALIWRVITKTDIIINFRFNDYIGLTDCSSHCLIHVFNLTNGDTAIFHRDSS